MATDTMLQPTAFYLDIRRTHQEKEGCESLGENVLTHSLDDDGA